MLASRGLLLLLVLDVVDGVLYGGDLLGIFVGYVDIEGFFKRHHQLHDIERIRTQIIHERSGIVYLILIHAKLLDDDLFHSLFNRHESSKDVCKLIDSSDDDGWPQLRRRNSIDEGLRFCSLPLRYHQESALWFRLSIDPHCIASLEAWSRVLRMAFQPEAKLSEPDRLLTWVRQRAFVQEGAVFRGAVRSTRHRSGNPGLGARGFRPAHHHRPAWSRGTRQWWRTRVADWLQHGRICGGPVRGSAP